MDILLSRAKCARKRTSLGSCIWGNSGAEQAIVMVRDPRIQEDVPWCQSCFFFFFPIHSSIFNSGLYIPEQPPKCQGKWPWQALTDFSLKTSKKKKKKRKPSLSTVTPREGFMTVLLEPKWSYIHSKPKCRTKGMGYSTWSAWDRRCQWCTGILTLQRVQKVSLHQRTRPRRLGNHTERMGCFSWDDWSYWT